MAPPADVCLRCGDFVREAPVPGLALCAPCLEPKLVPAQDSLPPPGVRRPRFLLFTGVLLLSIVAHLVALATTLQLPATGLVIMSVVFGAADGFLCGVLPLQLLLGNVGYGGFRKPALEAVGLPEDAPFTPAYLLDERSGMLGQGTFSHRELGVAALADDALVFLGHSGSRVVIRRRDAGLATERTLFQIFPPRRAVHLVTVDGASRWIAFLAGARAENVRLARAAADLFSGRRPAGVGPTDLGVGPYGLVIAGLALASKREAAVALMTELRGLSHAEAYELCRSPVVVALKGVSREGAVAASRRFEAAGIVSRVVGDSGHPGSAQTPVA